jgi:glucose/arabinose dehydrogenase
MFTAGLTGISFLDSFEYGPKYHSDLFAGDFHNGYLYDFNLSKNRNHLDLSSLSTQKAVHNETELGGSILGKDFGGIVDVKESPDGFLYVLSTHKGGDDCLEVTGNCLPYLSSVGGTIYKIVLKRDSGGTRPTSDADKQ